MLSAPAPVAASATSSGEHRGSTAAVRAGRRSATRPPSCSLAARSSAPRPAQQTGAPHTSGASARRRGGWAWLARAAPGRHRIVAEVARPARAAPRDAGRCRQRGVDAADCECVRRVGRRVFAEALAHVDEARRRGGGGGAERRRERPRRHLEHLGRVAQLRVQSGGARALRAAGGADGSAVVNSDACTRRGRGHGRGGASLGRSGGWKGRADATCPISTG